MVERSLKLLRFFQATLTGALRTRVFCAIETAEKFAETLENEKELLRKSLPDVLFNRLFKDGAPIKLNDCTFRLFAILFTASDSLKKNFSKEELSAVKKLNKLLLECFCVKYGLKCANDRSLEEVTSDVVENASKLGLIQAEIEALLEAESATDEEDFDAFLEELKADEPFQAVFLKRVDKHVKKGGSKTEDSLKEHLIAIQKITEKEQLNLNRVANVRAAVERQVRADQRCAFCQHPLTQPRTLPCLHSFCADCIKQHLSSTDKLVTCAVCERRVAVPSLEYVDTLPCAFVLDSLLQLIQKLPTGDCDQCEFCIHAATNFSISTGKVFCECHSAPFYHPSDKSNNNQLIPVASLLDSAKVAVLLQTYCPLHSQALDKFCPSCQVPTCSNAACVAWHSKHGDLRPLDEVVEEHKRQLQSLVDVVGRKATRVARRIAAAEQNQISMADLQENIRGSIDQYFDDMLAKLAERRADFHRDLDKAAEACCNQDEQTLTNLGAWIEKAAYLQREFASIMFQRDATSQNQQQPSIPAGDLTVLRQKLLNILSDTVDGATLADAKTLSYPEGDLRVLLQALTTVKSNISSSNGQRGWEAVVKAPGIRNYAVADSRLFVLKKTMLSNCQVHLHDLKNPTAETVVCLESGSHDYRGLALTDQGDLLVPLEVQSNLELPSMRFKKSVQVLHHILPQNRTTNGLVGSSVTLECLNTFNKVILKSAMVQSCAEPKGDLRWYLGDDQCICEVMPCSGQLVRKFDYYTMVSISDFCPDPDRDLLIVTDATRHNLLIFNCQRQDMVTVGGQGATPGLFSFPAGVCVDRFGHIFVGDAGNARIQVFDLAGKFLRLLPYPSAVKEAVSDPKINPNASVVLQAVDDYLYLFDSRFDAIYRVKYF